MSEKRKSTADSICEDLEAVLAWLDRPLDEIILVGFGLGCYPSAKIASMYKVKGIIMISPMLSLTSLLLPNQDVSYKGSFAGDQLNIIDLVEEI